MNIGADRQGVNQYDGRIVVQSLKSGESKTILERGTDGRYIPTGHIIYFAGTTLFAVPFDLGRREATGRGVLLVENVSRRLLADNPRPVYATVSATGMLAYVSGAFSREVALELIDRAGQMTPLNIPPATYGQTRPGRSSKSCSIGSKS
jgi:hypothetical protein